MPLLETLKKNLPYLFALAGAAWAAVLYDTSSVLILWPVIASFVSAGLLLVFKEKTLTEAWTSASALLGFLLAAFQAYAAVGLLSGAFTTVATESLVAFVLFAALHLFILYAVLSKSKPAE